jgi:xylulokinase
MLIGIDLGTTRLKVSAFTRSGTLHHQLTHRHVDHVHNGYRWQDADEWWHHTCRLIREVVASVQESTILGLSVTGRGGAAVFTDDNDQVLSHPWADTRHSGELAELYAWREGRDLSNYGAGLCAKYLWLQRNDTGLARRIRKGFFAKDWLLYCLTGTHITDWTSGPDGPAWTPGLERDLGLPERLLPDVGLPWDIAGGLRAGVARQIGLPAGLPVAVGGHDGLCANIGVGVVRPEQMAVTIGTHAVVRMVMSNTPAHAYRFYRMPTDCQIIGGNAVMGGRSADWFLDLIDTIGADRDLEFERMDAYAAGVQPGSEGVRFLPFLAGQVAPTVRPGARAVFSGLTLNHGREHMYRAVLEGASFAIRSIFDQVIGWCGQPSVVRTTGSGAKSDVWTSMLADVLNKPIDVSDQAVEGRGAVIALAVALGLYSRLDQAAEALVCIGDTVQPDTERVASYEGIYNDWIQLNMVSGDYDLTRAERRRG